MTIPTSPENLSLSLVHPGEKMTGELLGASDLLGDISSGPAGAQLAATIAGASTITGDLGGPGQAELIGTLAGTSTIAGDLSQAGAIDLSGTLAGTSTITGLVSQAGAELVGNLTGGSDLQGAISGGGAELAGTLAGSSTVIGILDAVSVPIIPATLDLSPFFNVGELAHPALLNGAVSCTVILTQWYNELAGGTVGMAGTEPLVIARQDETPGIAEGDELAIGSITYIVREVMPDNTGLVRLRCEYMPIAVVA